MSDDAPRTITLPASALLALRGAVLGAADGELRLRDAGYLAGASLYDDFAAYVRTSEAAMPDALPLPRFAAALGEYLEASGWGAARIDATSNADVMRVTSSDWVEAEHAQESPYPSCHF